MNTSHFIRLDKALASPLLPTAAAARGGPLRGLSALACTSYDSVAVVKQSSAAGVRPWELPARLHTRCALAPRARPLAPRLLVETQAEHVV